MKLQLPVVLLLLWRQAACEPHPTQADSNSSEDAVGMNVSEAFEEQVAQPLSVASSEVREKVAELLGLIDSPSDIAELSAEVRALVADVVPRLLKIRDASSAMDISSLPLNTSNANVAQQKLIALQTYSSWAWPVIMDQVNVAFEDDADAQSVSTHIRHGIGGSEGFLEPVLNFTWHATKFMLPVVDDLRVGKSVSAVHAEGAKCASNYATALGELTAVYADLAKADVQCKSGGGSAPKTAQACAESAVSAFRSVAATVSQASDAMWQCFGLYWGCAELINGALEQLVAGLEGSIRLSSDCSTDQKTCQPFRAYTVMQHLTLAAGKMDSSAEWCLLKGYKPNVLNPFVATPAELRFPVENSSTAAPNSSAPAPPLPALVEEASEIGSSAVGDARPDEIHEISTKDLRHAMLSFVADLNTFMHEVQVEANAGASGAHDEVEPDMVALAHRAIAFLRAKVPAFVDLVSESAAIKVDPAVVSLGGKAALAQKDLMKMMHASLKLTPKVLRQAALSTAEDDASGETFAKNVSADVEVASSFLAGAVQEAWDGVALQLPRIETFINGSKNGDPEKMLSDVACASHFAISLGQLTSLYSNLASTASDCNVSDGAFNSLSCEADMLSALAHIQITVSESSKMMQACFDSSWRCSEKSSKAIASLLNAMLDSLRMQAQCKAIADDLNTRCESSAYGLLGNLASAAEAVEASAQECSSDEPLEDEGFETAPAPPPMFAALWGFFDGASNASQSKLPGRSLRSGKGGGRSLRGGKGGGGGFSSRWGRDDDDVFQSAGFLQLPTCRGLNQSCWVDAQCCSARCQKAIYGCRPLG